MKRILVIISLWMFAAGCRTHYPYNYIIAGLTLHNEDNSGLVPVDANTNDIPAKAYAIRLEFANELTNPEKYHNDESYYTLLNPAKTFTITSLSDFDNTHPAGSVLNDYFLYGASTYEVNNTDSIQNKIGKIGRGKFNFSQELPNSWTTNDYLLLMQPPAVPGNRSFVLHMELKDSTSITDTITVNLLP
jgi:hypothetical protein